MIQPFFPSDGSWVGPPALYLLLSSFKEPMLLDGRKRLDEHKLRRLKTPIPKLIVHSHLDVVKQLVLAHHHERAATHIIRYLPEYVNNTGAMWKALTGFHHNKFQPVLMELRGPEGKHRFRGRAMSVVKAVRQLVLRADEGEEITRRHLVDALGKFFEG